MMNMEQIKEKMDVVGSDGMHIGTVDRAEGNQIKLTKKDSAEGAHHLIPMDWVESIEGNEIRLHKMAEEAKAEWKETGDGETGAPGGNGI